MANIVSDTVEIRCLQAGEDVNNKVFDMTAETFESFQSRKLNEGFDEVLVRNWEPGFSNEPHEHPFDTVAWVAKGEFWLTMNDKTTHYTQGDMFQVDRGVTHHETYGPEGAVFWAARKN